MINLYNSTTLFFGPGGSDEPEHPNTITLFVGSGTGGGGQKPPLSRDGDPTIFFALLAAVIAAIIVKLVNKKK